MTSKIVVSVPLRHGMEPKEHPEKVWLHFTSKEEKDALRELYPKHNYKNGQIVEELTMVWFPLIKRLREEVERGVKTTSVDLIPNIH